MAKQQSLVVFKGKLNGLSFYMRNHRYFVRMPGGPSKEKIRNSPSCARIRESNREFAGATQVAKALRASLPMQLLAVRDTYFAVRLNGVFKRMCDLGEGIRGQRSISTAQHGKLLQGFAFSQGVAFDSVFRVTVLYTCTPERTEVFAHVPEFQPSVAVFAPKGATHFRLLFCAVSLSDYVSPDGLYVPVLPALNGLSAVAESALLPLEGTIAPFVLPASFASVTALPAQVALVLSMGIVFYQRVDGVDYGLKDGGCAGVVKSVNQ